MPILKGDHFIGRIDPAMDRTRRRLKINAVYAEPNAETTKEAGQMVADAIESLGDFLGAKKVIYSRHVPAAWKSSLQEVA